MNDLKYPLTLAAGICSIWLLLFMYKSYLDKDLRSHDADRADAKAHHDKCTEARVGFFEDCYQWGRGRFECEALWAQKSGHIFDGPPQNQWVDEIDCSTEVKNLPGSR